MSTGGGGTASDFGSLSVEHASSNSLIAWTDFRSGRDDIYGARISQDGVVANPGGSLISTNTAGSDQLDPTIATNGADYFVVWEDNRNGSAPDIYGTRLSSTGTVGDPPASRSRPTPGDRPCRRSPGAGSEYLVAWTDDRLSGILNIIGSWVSTDGMVKDTEGFLLAPSFNEENSPTLTKEWQLVYSRLNPGGYAIFTRSISPK